MLLAFSVVRRMARDVFDEFMLVTFGTLTWAILAGPLLAFTAFYLSEGGSPLIAAALMLLNVLPSGPASAGLAELAKRIIDGRSANMGNFFAAMRQYARQGWVISGLWTAGLLIILLNLNFYANLNNLLGGILNGLWIYALMVWFGLQIYMFPLLLAAETPRLRPALRNAFFLVLGKPVFTITTLLLMTLFVAVSVVLPILLTLITSGILAVWGARATEMLLAAERARRNESQAQQAPPEPEKGRRGQVRPK